MGRRLARLATVAVRLCVARCCIDGWRCSGGFRASWSTLEVVAAAAAAFIDGSLVGTVGLDLIVGVDILGFGIDGYFGGDDDMRFSI